MVVEVVIENKNYPEKEYSFSDIIIEGMNYGISNNSHKLEKNKIGKYTIVFNSQKICRGHEVYFNDNKIFLSLTLLTSESDIIFFYKHIKFVCGLYQTNEFLRDQRRASLDLIDSYIEMDKRASIDALCNISQKLNQKEFDRFLLFGVCNPISIGLKECEFVSNDIQKFEDFLDKLQRIDAYYSTPAIYSRPDKSLFAVYSILNDLPTIFPLNPKPLFSRGSFTEFYVGFVKEKQFFGTIKFKDFIENVDKSEMYDEARFLISVSKDAMMKLLEKFRVEI